MIVTMSNDLNQGQPCHYATMPSVAGGGVELVKSNDYHFDRTTDGNSVWRSPPPPVVGNTYFLSPVVVPSTPPLQHPLTNTENVRNHHVSTVTCATKRDWNSSRGVAEAAVSTILSPHLVVSVQPTPAPRSETFSVLNQSFAVPVDPVDDSSRPSSSKKSRPNNYIAPKVVAKTYNSEVGSLALAGAVKHLPPQHLPPQHFPSHGGSNGFRFNLRRQLSGSKIESFLSNGEQDSMEVDDSTKPRSMSF